MNGKNTGPGPRKRGLSTLSIVIAVVVVGAAGFGAYALLSGGGGSASAARTELFAAQRGGFDITIPASGELAAQKQKEIVNELEVRAVITEIVEEGKFVQEGDVLLRLDDESIRDEIRDAQDSVNTAEASWISARSNLDIRRESSRSELQKADVDVRLAELALKAWEEGEHVSQLQTLELDVETAEKDYARLKDRFERSKDLLDREFISQDEYRQDEIELMRAKSRYDQAVLSLRVYKQYEAEQRREQLESDLQQAQDAREETKNRNETELTSLEADVASKLFNLESRRERLEKLEGQLEKCIVYAPQSGLVVYASSLDSDRWRRRDDPPQVGTEISRNETVMVLPDTSRMVARVKVNEALAGRIEPEQKAVVISDAVPGEPIQGQVQSVGVLAESGGWRDPNRRDYTVSILLEKGEELGLKPSMRCKAEIFVGRVEDAIYVPVQAIHRAGRTAYVYVVEEGGYAQRPVQLGRSSELYIEIAEGLDEGERVLLMQPDASSVTTTLEDLAGDEGGDQPQRRGPGGRGGGRPADV